jgi:cell division protein FtsN
MNEMRMKQQRGGTILGFIIGVMVGLGAALAVAVYVTKVPIPFVNKGQSRSADQDAAETQKNKDWNPNAPLAGKHPVKAPAAAAPESALGSPPVPAAVPVAPPAPVAAPVAAPKADYKPAVSADPLGDLAKARAAAAGDLFAYWVQVGAFRTSDDAQSQRAKLSLNGIESKVTEREQSGRTVFRVRVGPIDKKEEADKIKGKLDASGLESVVVRVPR